MLLSNNLRKKSKKSVKQSEIITYQPNFFESPNVVDIKSAVTEHLKTWHKLSTNIGKSENIGSNSSLCSDTKKMNIFERKII